MTTFETAPLPVDELMSPFSVDQSQLSANFPSIEEGRQALWHAVAGRSQAEPSTEGTSRTLYRAGRARLEPLFVEVIAKAAALVADYELNEEGLHVVFDTIHDKFFGTDTKPFEEILTGGIAHMANALRQFKQRSVTIEKDVSESIAGSHTARYELLKYLAAKDKRPKAEVAAAPKEEKWTPNQVLSAALYAVKSPLLFQLNEELSQGEFDEYIAADVVRFALAHPEMNGSVSKMRQLARFYMAVVSHPEAEDPEGHAVEGMLRYRQDWPVEQRESVESARTQLVTDLQLAQKDVTDYLSKFSPVHSEDTLADFEGVATRLGVVCLKDARPEIYNRSAMLRAQAAAKSAKRRRTTVTVDPAELATASSEAALDPLELVTFSATGEIQEGIESIAQEFIDKYGKSNQQLIADVERIFEYMRGLDFTKGLVRGIKKLHNEVRLEADDARDARVKLWEFKPLEAPGIPTNTRSARECRVLFVPLGDKQLGVLTILDKKEVSSFLHNLKAQVSSVRR